MHMLTYRTRSGGNDRQTSPSKPPPYSGAAEYTPLLTQSIDQQDIYTEPRQEYSPEKTAVVNNSCSINGEERTMGE